MTKPFMWVKGGRHVDLIDPKQDQIYIADIASALSKMNRWAGHTRFPYSVAQHSTLMSELCLGPMALQALLHDAAEAYLVDMPSPQKRLIGEPYAKLERTFLEAISERFGVDLVNLDPHVKDLDLGMCRLEALHLVGVSLDEVREHFGTVSVPPVNITRMSAEDAEQAFLRRFEQLRHFGRSAA